MEENNEIITITNVPLHLIPADTPSFLTDRTWHDIIENLHCGIPMTKTLREIGCDGRVYGKVMKWIYANDERKEQFLEAKKISTELLADEIVDIADGIGDSDNAFPEELGRSKLRIETRKYLMGFNNKDRYGDSKKIDLNVLLWLIHLIDNNTLNIVDVKNKNLDISKWPSVINRVDAKTEYETWCTSLKHAPVSSIVFYRTMRSVGFKDSRAKVNGSVLRTFYVPDMSMLKEAISGVVNQ